MASRFSAPNEIALAAALGAFLGLVPMANFFWLVVLVLLFRLKSNVVAGLLSALFFGFIGLWCEPFLHRAGFLVLTWKPLVPIWTWLFNLPLTPWTGFNQTLVMGGICAGAYLLCPVYVLTKWLIERYESPVVSWLQHQVWLTELLNSVRDWGRVGP